MVLEVTVCHFSAQVVLSLVLLLVAVIRQNLLSGCYLFLFLLSPFFPKPTSVNVNQGRTSSFVKASLIVTLFICICQITFQALLLINTDLASQISNCSFTSRILILFGFVNLFKLDLAAAFRYFVIDFIVLTLVVIIQIFTKSAYARARHAAARRRSLSQRNGANTTQEEAPVGELPPAETTTVEDHQTQHDAKLHLIKVVQVTRYFFELMFLMLLSASAVFSPSIISFFYFISLLFVITLVASNVYFRRFYEHFRLMVCLYSALHLIILFAYQLPQVNQAITQSSLEARILGLIEYTNVPCENPAHLNFNTLNWNVYAHPFCLVFLYFVAAIFVRERLFRTKSEYKLARDVGFYPSYRYKVVGSGQISSNLDHIPLLQSTPTKYDSFSTTNTGGQLKQRQQTRDSSDLEEIENGQTEWRSASSEHLPAPSTTLGRTVPSPSILANLVWGEFDRFSNVNLLVTTLQLMKRGSYVATLIVMMTWSITYHSWIGFVLLCWSCVIWMMPNSRRACLNSSPFLITYVIILLLLNYVFSLNLHELPTEIAGFKLDEIGFKVEGYESAYQPLLIKLAYTIVFYITLRQYVEERQQAREDITRRPSQVETDTGPTLQMQGNWPAEMHPSLLKMLGKLHLFLCKYWILIVTLLLMIMSMSGSKVVLYRVVYMFLFLNFVLVFQISYCLWKCFAV